MHRRSKSADDSQRRSFGSLVFRPSATASPTTLAYETTPPSPPGTDTKMSRSSTLSPSSFPRGSTTSGDTKRLSRFSTLSRGSLTPGSVASPTIKKKRVVATNHEHGHGQYYQLQEFLQCERDEMATLLSLGFQPLEDEKAKDVAGVLRKNPHIRGVCLRGTQLSYTGVCELAKLIPSSSYTGLDVADNPLGSLGVKQLAQALAKNRTVTSLQLDNVRLFSVFIGEEKNIYHGAKTLFGALATSRIELLSLFRNEIGKHMPALLSLNETLMVSDRLHTLNLMSNNIGPKGLEKLSLSFMAGMNQSVTHLNLSYNELGVEGAKTLSKILKSNRTLLRLELWRNKFGDVGAEHLAEGLKDNKTLTHLDLRLNDLEEKGSTAIAVALAPDRAILNCLDMWNNTIGTRGSLSFGQIMKLNKNLTSLNLRGSNPGTQGVIHLADGIKDAVAITDLSLKRCKLTGDDIIPLAAALEVNQTLCNVNLSQNRIGSRLLFKRSLPGIEALAKVFKNNSRLIYLSLDDNDIDDEGAAMLGAALKSNTRLIYLNLEMNPFKTDKGVKLCQNYTQRNIDAIVRQLLQVLPFPFDLIDIIAAYTSFGGKPFLPTDASDNGYEVFQWKGVKEPTGRTLGTGGLEEERPDGDGLDVQEVHKLKDSGLTGLDDDFGYRALGDGEDD